MAPVPKACAASPHDGRRALTVGSAGSAGCCVSALPPAPGPSCERRLTPPPPPPGPWSSSGPAKAPCTRRTAVGPLSAGSCAHKYSTNAEAHAVTGLRTPTAYCIRHPHQQLADGTPPCALLAAAHPAPPRCPCPSRAGWPAPCASAWSWRCRPPPAAPQTTPWPRRGAAGAARTARYAKTSTAAAARGHVGRGSHGWQEGRGAGGMRGCIISTTPIPAPPNPEPANAFHLLFTA